MSQVLPTHDGNGKFAKGNRMSPGRTPLADGGKPNRIKQARELIEDQLEQVIQSMIESALKGDTAAGKLVISLVMPQLKQIDNQITDMSKLPRMIVESKVVIDAEPIDAELVENKPVNKQISTKPIHPRAGQ